MNAEQFRAAVQKDRDDGRHVRAQQAFCDHVMGNDEIEYFIFMGAVVEGRIQPRQRRIIRKLNY